MNSRCSLKSCSEVNVVCFRNLSIIVVAIEFFTLHSSLFVLHLNNNAEELGWLSVQGAEAVLFLAVEVDAVARTEHHHFFLDGYCEFTCYHDAIFLTGVSVLVGLLSPGNGSTCTMKGFTFLSLKPTARLWYLYWLLRSISGPWSFRVT